MRLGRFKGLAIPEILFQSPSRSSAANLFAIKYYPQSHKPCDTAPSLPLRFCYIVPIAKTSKSAILRRRLKHRLEAAFRAAIATGHVALPVQRPMNLVISPSMHVLRVPFPDLVRDVQRTMPVIHRQFEALSYRQRQQQQSHAPARAPSLLRQGRPEMKSREASQKTLRKILRSLPTNSTYLHAHGGSEDMLRRMQDTLHKHKVTS